MAPIPAPLEIAALRGKRSAAEGVDAFGCADELECLFFHGRHKSAPCVGAPRVHDRPHGPIAAPLEVAALQAKRPAAEGADAFGCADELEFLLTREVLPQRGMTIAHQFGHLRARDIRRAANPRFGEGTALRLAQTRDARGRPGRVAAPAHLLLLYPGPGAPWSARWKPLWSLGRCP